ncbi:MAG: F0F1 ATP synthase subunit delta [Candidatus Levyibacteriota bacterium]|nr:MAG: F0F1 ATP synthase subunit delta [Candidatus Levybacteria bacterium]
MTKKIIKELVLASYTKGNLDPQKVEKIAKILNRTMLKQYIKGLKQRESYLSVAIDSALEVDDKQKDELQEIFPNKKITYNTNSQLIAGIKITKDDIIYEMTIKGALDLIFNRIRNNYD